MINNKTELALAEQVRAACLQAALAAYEEGGMLCLCQQGRFELAMDAIATLNLAAMVQTTENK
ncbi:hypothetical protein CBP31_09045 [Oceanisphaera profunda]|uniref:Acetyltransferase n=1 Tax=Oceanisphaera profunda TaxID=1416627 RepID=A0A1Y0D5D0_9GAMM|nr:hypothetical protein [Oceanisphaera profunda]ART82751.1 hypothetical protein CBP31_09045 [Oceanisphaera profunda]